MSAAPAITEVEVPTYQYACVACGHQLEAVQSFADEPLTECPACEGRLRKLFSSVGIVFKGSGFYRNDSRSGNGSGSGSGSTEKSEKKELAGVSAGTDKSTPAASSGSSGGSESAPAASKSSTGTPGTAAA